MELNFNFMGMGVRIGGRELPVFFEGVSTQINQGGGIIFWFDFTRISPDEVRGCVVIGRNGGGRSGKMEILRVLSTQINGSQPGSTVDSG